MKRSMSILAPLTLVIGLALSACATTPTSSSTPTPQTATSATSSVPAASPAATKPAASPAAQTPRYGGTINLGNATDTSTWDDPTVGGSSSWASAPPNEKLLGGDWTKGAAGGYGTNETDWGSLGYDLFSNKAGYLAESWSVNVDAQNGQGTVIFKIRPGVHYALDPNNEASRQVGGREVTADDVLAAIKKQTTDTKGYIYRSNPELRNVDATKTGSMEITVKAPIDSFVTALSRIGDSTRIYPVEVLDKLVDWKNHVGTGPFMVRDYVAGSTITYVKNPNYWMKDPIGPGKGNQLPYADGLQFFIIPDTSTTLTAFRTGKIDILNANWEDAAKLKKDFPQMPVKEGEGGTYGGDGYMRTDKPPYNDLRVRRAMMMATDFNTIKQTINGGTGQIITFPFPYLKEYADLYVSVDDPDLPPQVKEQFVYNPDKAKQLLTEAGYPNGFKSSIMVLSSQTSYWEAIAAMWKKVGIDLAIDVKDSTVQTNLVNSQSYTDLTTGPGKAPVAIYYSGNGINGVPSAQVNISFVDDPRVKDMLPKIRALAATDEKAAMKLDRELTKYALEQAWVIQVPRYASTTFWWPWLKNYSGEISVGYYHHFNWTQWAWVDQALKQSMGH